MQTVSLIRRALKKEDFATAIRLTEEHYLLFDHSHPLLESYAYPNLARFCGEQLVLKEIKKKDELFNYILNTTKTYTALVFKLKDNVRCLYLLKKIQQSINENNIALLNKKQFDYVKKWDEFVLSVFDGSSEKKRNYFGYTVLFRKQEELKNAAVESSSLYKNTEDKLSDYVSADYYFPEWDKSEYRMANTGKNCSYLTKKEKAVLYVMNLARLDPVLFEKTFLKKYLEEHPEEVGQYSGSLRSRLLRGQVNAPYLPDSVLFLAAEIHAKDFGEKGREGHGGLYNGPDGRAKHFGYIGEGIGECCDYGMELPEEMVLHLLVDSGVADLGHREALLSVEYVAVGISIQPHKEHGVNCVLDFTE